MVFVFGHHFRNLVYLDLSDNVIETGLLATKKFSPWARATAQLPTKAIQKLTKIAREELDVTWIAILVEYCEFEREA